MRFPIGGTLLKANCHRIISNYKELGYTGGYVITVPLMETPKYMPWLVNEFKNLGGKIARKSRRISRLSELYAENQIIVNCTGLGASELCGDEQVYFNRAQVVRTNNPGICRGYADVSGPLNLAYIIPRTHDCILGGTADKNKGSERLNRAKTQEILYKCQQLEPALQEVKYAKPIVGRRPERSRVCLKREQVSARCVVIHNYGHGGAGFTVSWGCADEVVRLAESSLGVFT